MSDAIVIPLDRECVDCHEVKPLADFHRDQNGKFGRYAYCKACTTARRRAEYDADPEKFRTRSREASKRRKIMVRAEVMAAYGGACKCCGEDEDAFLCIDHISNDGAAHRRETGGGGAKTYEWLRRNGFPEGFQVLCHNCNQAKFRLGECPHRAMIEEAV